MEACFLEGKAFNLELQYNRGKAYLDMLVSSVGDFHERLSTISTISM